MGKKVRERQKVYKYNFQKPYRCTRAEIALKALSGQVYTYGPGDDTRNVIGPVPDDWPKGPVLDIRSHRNLARTYNATKTNLIIWDAKTGNWYPVEFTDEVSGEDHPVA
jgi:hypothetical protein